jgi:vancomycin resistance protein VanJ
MGLCFYVPSPFVAAFWSVVLWRNHRRRKPLRAAAAAVPALAGLLVVAFVENRAFPPERPSPLSRETPGENGSGRLRFVHWNVFAGRLGWTAVEDELRAERADLYLLSEIPRPFDAHALAGRLGSDYTAVAFRPMAVIARGELRAGRWLFRRRDGRAALLEWQSPAGLVAIIAADLTSRLEVQRGPLLEELLAHIRAEAPDLVLGDWNAPRRSIALGKLPDGYAHAYDRAGSGWSYTWPVPVAAWAIDHMIVGPRLVVENYELVSSWRSDHRRQVLIARRAGAVDAGETKNAHGRR